MLAAYLVLGAVFDELAAMVVTLPFALPIIIHFGYDPVWWGIINVIIVELGLVIPPIGLLKSRCTGCTKASSRSW